MNQQDILVIDDDEGDYETRVIDYSYNQHYFEGEHSMSA